MKYLCTEISFLFCFILLFGCASSKTSKNSDFNEKKYSREFIKSWPDERPAWIDSIPENEEELYFTGVSRKAADIQEARSNAMADARRQIVSYYGVVIRDSGIERKSVQGLSTDILDPYIEEEKIIQSFAERYISQVAADKFYTEQFIVTENGTKKEDFTCYVLCQIPKAKVQKEIDEFAKNTSERYVSLLPEKSALPFSSVISAVTAYKSVLSSLEENPIHRSVAYIETSSGKAGLYEYTQVQIQRLLKNCSLKFLQDNSNKNKIEKGEIFSAKVKITSPDYKNSGSLDCSVKLFSSGNLIAEIPYKSSDDGIVNISLSTKKLPLGLYTLSAELSSGEQNTHDSILFTVVPIQASIVLDSDTEMIRDSKIFIEKIQRLLDSNEIPIKISEEKKLSNEKFKFTIHISSEIFGSQDEIKKFKISSAYITFEKNGENILQSDSKSVWGKLSRDLTKSAKSAVENIASAFEIDSEFAQKIQDVIGS